MVDWFRFTLDHRFSEGFCKVNPCSELAFNKVRQPYESRHFTIPIQVTFNLKFNIRFSSSGILSRVTGPSPTLSVPYRMIEPWFVVKIYIYALIANKKRSFEQH